MNDQIKFINLDLKNITQDHLKENINFEPDFLILNAGLNRDNLFLRMSDDEWNDVMDVNLNATFKLVKFFFKRNGQTKIWKNSFYYICCFIYR